MAVQYEHSLFKISNLIYYEHSVSNISNLIYATPYLERNLSVQDNVIHLPDWVDVQRMFSGKRERFVKMHRNVFQRSLRLTGLLDFAGDQAKFRY